MPWKAICNPCVSSEEGEKMREKIGNVSNKESYVHSKMLLLLAGNLGTWNLISAINSSLPDKWSHQNEKSLIV